MRFRARLLRDILTVTKKFPKGSVQYLVCNGNRLHIEGYQATTIVDSAWELYWDEYQFNKVRNGE